MVLKAKRYVHDSVNGLLVLKLKRNPLTSARGSQVNSERGTANSETSSVRLKNSISSLSAMFFDSPFDFYFVVKPGIAGICSQSPQRGDSAGKFQKISQTVPFVVSASGRCDKTCWARL